MTTGDKKHTLIINKNNDSVSLNNNKEKTLYTYQGEIMYIEVKVSSPNLASFLKCSKQERLSTIVEI